MKGRWIFRGIGFLILCVLGLFLFGYITMRLWNGLIPQLFNGPVVTYWQAFGLLILAKILTWGGWRGRRSGGCCNHGRHGYWKQRMDEKIANMSPEEREKFMAKMKEKCGWYYDKGQSSQSPWHQEPS
jgi:hypothetical protein